MDRASRMVKKGFNVIKFSKTGTTKTFNWLCELLGSLWRLLLTSFVKSQTEFRKFDYLEIMKKQRLAAVLVVLSDLVALGLTLLYPHYEGSIAPSFITLILMGTWTFFTAGGSLQNLKRCLLCGDSDFLLSHQHLSV
ncbi:PREDICTED: gamma-secretase subunit Aph-1b-like [Chlamydotis macqueenii]|uniref:gamma-secretase subunit Aph-1b-like n=1 Tax=Chlamydotis macqueenii TaxID=187382 RepID=UPI000529ECA4|nr:PREDICTED: gamma-secretase subunit Aph-1b-like [Chlamydotis macqueenii]